jgi:predicted nucleic acid-binding protein
MWRLGSKRTGNRWTHRSGADPRLFGCNRGGTAGAARAGTEKRQAARQRFLDDLLSGLPVHPVTVSLALRAGKIDGLLQAQGKRVALADLLIGVTALALGYAVATHNVRHFGMIPDLIVKPL